MSERSIVVRLRAEVAGFKKAMDDAATSADNVGAAFDKNGKKIETASGRMVRSAEVNRDAWTTAGASITAFGVVGVAAMAMSAKAAIDWESAWTGVAKTVDGSHEQMVQLEDDLREMARTLPATHEEIAATAEAAGQLGVAVDDVAAFTKVMIDLGNTTNLSADEAATSIAQLMNVMQTAPEDVDNLGAALVALGNNGASTERDIIQMAQRIGGAGEIIGLTEGEVLGLANALSSAGIEVEAGGSAISNIMIDIAKATSAGGEDLEAWAEVAGMSAQDFAAAWESDPARALATMIEGLGEMNAAGGDVFATLEGLGQSDVRVTRALLSMATSGDLLTKSLELGNQAWADNTALIAEAEKRYDTTEAKIQIAKNSLNDAAITIGEQLLPALASMAEGVADAASWFAQLPEPVARAVAVFGSLGSGVALLTGGFLLMLPRIIETRRALKTLNADMPGFTKNIGKATAALAVLASASVIPEWGTTASGSVGTVTESLLDMADGAEVADTALGKMFERGGAKDWFTGNDISDVSEAFRNLAAPSVGQGIDNVASSILTLGQSTSTSRKQSQEFFAAVDQGLTSLVQSGAADEASAALSSIAEQAGVSRKEIRQFLPEYVGAMDAIDTESRTAADSTFELTGAFEAVEGAATDFNQALSDQIDLLITNGKFAMDADSAQAALEQAFDDATAAIEANGKTLDITTQKGRDNQAALQDVASSALELVDSLDETGASSDEMRDSMEKGRDQFIKTGKQMGLTADEAEDLADKYGLIPEDIETVVTANTTQARSAIHSLMGLYSDAQFATFAGAYTKRATGGPVYGPGSSTSDSIPAWLSNGEYVQTTAAHNFWGTRMMDSLNARDVSGVMGAIASRGYASGGPVMSAGSSPSITVRPSLGDVVAVMDDATIDKLAAGMMRAAGVGTDTALAGAARLAQQIARQGAVA